MSNFDDFPKCVDLPKSIISPKYKNDHKKQVTYLRAPPQPLITSILRRMILVLNRDMDKALAQAQNQFITCYTKCLVFPLFCTDLI